MGAGLGDFLGCLEQEIRSTFMDFKKAHLVLRPNPGLYVMMLRNEPVHLRLLFLIQQSPQRK